MALGILLYTQETLLKYIGRLHSYLRHIILVFNPITFDEVCVQATHVEDGKKYPFEKSSKNRFRPPESKVKRKRKGKKNATVRKEGEKLFQNHCKKEVHDKARCWKLHLELKPNKFVNMKGENNTTTTIQQDL